MSKGFECFFNIHSQRSFRFITKLSGKYTELLHALGLQAPSLHYQHLHQGGKFVILDEPTLTHHHHSKSTDYMEVLSWCYHMGFDQCMYMAHSPPLHYLRIASLNTPSKFYLFTSLPLSRSWQPLILLCSP